MDFCNKSQDWDNKQFLYWCQDQKLSTPHPASIPQNLLDDLFMVWQGSLHPGPLIETSMHQIKIPQQISLQSLKALRATTLVSEQL